MEQRYKLWDLPTRLFHWLLVLCVVAAVVTGQIGGNLIDWHARIGIVIVGLIGFRLVWGLCGSTYARFAQFMPSPARIKAYLSGAWQGAGHNPLGALSVLGLLGLLTAQLLTGLFANDDIAFTGPLYALIDKDLSDRLAGLHRLGANLLFVLVGLHVAAIAFYGHVKKHNLVKPMVTGWAEGEAESARGGGLVAFLLAVAVAVLLAWGASGDWLPAPPPAPPASAAPAW